MMQHKTSELGWLIKEWLYITTRTFGAIWLAGINPDWRWIGIIDGRVQDPPLQLFVNARGKSDSPIAPDWKLQSAGINPDWYWIGIIDGRVVGAGLVPALSTRPYIRIYDKPTNNKASLRWP